MKRILLLLLLILIGKIGFTQNFNLNSVTFQVGDIYISNPEIMFEFNSGTIKNKSYNHLDSIAIFLLKNDSLNIEIGFHTDNRWSNEYSYRPDYIRADSIRAYLIRKGIDSKKLTAKSYGSNVLKVSDEEIKQMKTEQEKENAHAKNRRTEFRIIEIEH